MNQVLTSPEDMKRIVKDQYTAVVEQAQTSCCGPSCCSQEAEWIDFSEDYSKLDGYVADADFGLGCGVPTEFVDIKPGETVLDLGSGAGNDAFIARKLTGADGKVIGLDFTAAMVRRARENSTKLGFNNVEFREGDIESMPVVDSEIDVILSNCVLNLVPDKSRAFAEMYRVLKPGGRFSVSDIVTRGDIPDDLRNAAALYAGCVSGAVDIQDYLAGIVDAGFDSVKVVKEKAVVVPDSVIADALTEDGMHRFRNSKGALLSITVYGTKPV